MKLRKLTAALLSCCTVLLTGTGCGAAGIVPQSKADDMNTMSLVRDMGLGINLGNTFESCGDWISGDSVTSYETAWGSPVVTQEMIEGYKNEGFGVLRVPVAWSNMMEENYTIAPEYLARVHEVVSWALNADLYVILNIHWDGGWFSDFADPAKKDECMKKYTRIWQQLCEEFGKESASLIFESLNEEGGWDSLWNRYGSDDSGKAGSYALLNEINQTFVDLVRDSGGNNKTRHLLIAGYNTDVDLTCDPLFKMPDDPEGRCAVSVHYYTPPTFCILEEDASWGKARQSWGSPQDILEMQRQFDKLTERFVSQGVPVIIGEYGCPRKNKDAASVEKFLSSVCQEAIARDMCPVLWDTTGGFYDRDNAKMYSESLHDAMFAALNSQQEAA